MAFGSAYYSSSLSDWELSSSSLESLSTLTDAANLLEPPTVSKALIEHTTCGRSIRLGVLEAIEASGNVRNLGFLLCCTHGLIFPAFRTGSGLCLGFMQILGRRGRGHIFCGELRRILGHVFV